MMETVVRTRSNQPMLFLPFLPAFLGMSHQICLDFETRCNRFGDSIRSECSDAPVLLAALFG